LDLGSQFENLDWNLDLIILVALVCSDVLLANLKSLTDWTRGNVKLGYCQPRDLFINIRKFMCQPY